MAHGAPKPSILPGWHREILCAREPPRITCIHQEYQQLPPDSRSIFISHQRTQCKFLTFKQTKKTTLSLFSNKKDHWK
ncbi:13-hydroxylupanine O-tigloyltransferase [Glycine soja]|nr:13-hydroxylupanine O-tigloyltransferase [Glycine soja]